MFRSPSLPGLAATLLPLFLASPGSGQESAPATPPPAPAPGINIPLGFPPANSSTAPGGGATNGTPPAAADPANAGPGAMFDNRLPGVDPASGMIRFNGQTWDPMNNRVFAGRFEKYLNYPEELGESEQNHRAILNRIIAMLDPSNMTAQTLSDAYRLLNRAAGYPGDSRICDTLSNAIYTVWQSKRNQGRLAEANRIMEEERRAARRNMAGTASSYEVGVTAASAATGLAQGGQSSPSPGSSTPPGPGATTPPIPPIPPLPPGNQPRNQPQQQTTTQPQQGGATQPPKQSERGAQEARGKEFEGAILMSGQLEKVIDKGLAIKANQAKSELSELQAKLEYQGFLVQLFLQRRFHHLVIGTRFYRAIFSDGDSKLNLPDKSTQIFGSGGSPPTVTTLESLANEAMRDVQLGVQAFHSLVDAGELDSASKRLAEAFMIGEFMPEIRTLPKERKRKVLAYSQKANQLLAAIETKDYGLASETINGSNGLKAMAKDFDATKPNALIETSRNMARLHLAKARNAALSGDKPAFEAALAEAGKIWPNNPELIEVATKAFNQGDVQAQALVELEQLIAQKNFRRIAEEAGRFLAATHMAPPEKQSQLKSILEDFKSIEAALMGAKEMDRQGNPSGAWESVEKLGQKFPDDLQLAQSRALYTTKAADFVRAIQNAQDHERRAQAATSLAWFLKAQRLYPKSDFAEEAILRLKAQILPHGG